MKKLKIIVVSSLAVVLCLLCATTTTFSWFTRDKKMQGDRLGLNFNYDISTGTGVTMRTYTSVDDGKTYVETNEITAFSNSEGLAAGNRKCYRTDLINNGTAAQSVSLYLSKLTMPENVSGSFYLGVNGPLKTYKSYYGDNAKTIQKKESVINQKNVYVGFNTNQTYTPTNYKVHWWDNSNTKYNGDSSVRAYFSPNKEGSYDNQKYNMSYATIPWEANAVKLRQGDTWYGKDNTDIATNNIICLYQSGTNSFDTIYKGSGVAAGIEKFYSSANVTQGNTINLAATAQGTVTYSSSNTSVATVASDGTVTALKAGSAIITVTSEGFYGDKLTATCSLSVPSAQGNTKNDVPVVTNVKVPGVYADNEPGIVSVYWFIKNDSSTGPLTYTIDDLYLTL